MKYHAPMDITKIKKVKRVALSVLKINLVKIKVPLQLTVAQMNIQNWDRCYVLHVDQAMNAVKIKNVNLVNILIGCHKTVRHALNIFTVRPQTKKRFVLLVSHRTIQ